MTMISEQNSLKNLIHIAIEASIEAGAAIMEIYSDDFDVSLKSDNSPLTIADEKANDIINSFLIKSTIPVISEENKQLDYAVRSNWDPCWMVDPLDGTKEFVKRNGEFTVNIALIQHNKPVLGVIYIPVTKTLFYGLVKENKACKTILEKHEYKKTMFFNIKDEIKPLEKDLNSIKIVGSRSHKSEETELFIKSLNNEGKKIEFISQGSSIKFCVVAEGKASIYPRFAPTMEWDTAAGHAICNSVGVKVLNVNHKEEIKYNKENLLNPYFIVK